MDGRGRPRRELAVEGNAGSNCRGMGSEGWVFQKYPDFNTYQSEKLKLQLLPATATGG